MKKKYEKIKAIGKGNFAEVWLATDTSGKQVVLKEYNSESIAEARREYLFLKALKCADIVHAVEFQDEPPILVQEYVEGNTLQLDRFKTEKQKNILLAKLAAILAKMHSAGICYNDLKPDNIIIRDGSPVIIDLGLAVPNHFQDDIFRGTHAYAAPEKIRQNINSYAADTFAFGLLALQLKTGKLPADSMQFDEYKSLISDQEKCQEYVSDLSEDEFLLSILNFLPNQRPAMAEIAYHYANKAKISLERSIREFITQHIFTCQEKAILELEKQHLIVCNRSDEPERIIEHTILRLESSGKPALVLNESDFIWQPQEFFSQFQTQISSEQDLLNYLQEKKFNIVLHRNEISTQTHLFNIISELPDNYVVMHAAKSNLGMISFTEIFRLHEQYGINIDEIQKKYSGKPFLTRIQLLNKSGVKTEEKIPLQIISFLDSISMPISITLLEAVWKDSTDYLPALISHPAINIKGDSLVYNGVSLSGKIPKTLLERIFSTAEKMGNLAVAAKTALLLKQKSEAVNLLETYVGTLIKQEFYTSSYEVIRIFADKLSFPVSLQKKQAFLLWKNGFPEEAVHKYDAIKVADNSLEFATITADKAVILQEMNRIEEARQAYEKVLPIFSELDNKKSYLRILNNIGVIHVQSSHFIDAERTFLQMLEKAKKAKDIQFITMSHLNLADVFLRRGEWRKSLYQAQTAAEFGKKYNKKSIEIWSQIFGIQAQWALGSAENLAQIITEISRDPVWQEQTQLLEQFSFAMIPILLTLQPEETAELYEIARNAKQTSDEKYFALFWYEIHQNNYLEASKTLTKFIEQNAVRLHTSVLKGNSKDLVEIFRDLGIVNDCFAYLQAATLVSLLPGSNENRELQNEFSNFAAMHPFAPLNPKKESAFSPNQQHLSLLWNIISLIHSNESFNTTIQAILGGVIRIAHLERALYFSLNEGELLPQLGLDRDIKTISLTDIKISTTVLQETIKLGHIRYFDHLQEDVPFDIHSSIFGLGLRTAVCYPIIVNNEIRGVIYADATNAKQFNVQEQNLLEALFVQSRAALEKTERIETLLRERDQIKESAESIFPEIIGNSAPMQKIFTLMKMVGSHNVNVIITGPTGSGKELIARALHKEYNPQAAFVAVNCAAIPENLLESELFGYTKGAFTGAVRDKKGKIETANRGTLFLDEIGDMPQAVQAKLLRVLQERMITPLGSTKEIPVSFRIIAATNQNLTDMVDQGTFRKDLFYRLNVVEIDVPSLTERKDDILLLADFFRQKFNTKFGKQIKQINPRAAKALLQKDWKGNVRELENTMEKAVLLSQGEELETTALDISSDEFSFSSSNQLPIEWIEYRQYRRRIIHRLDKNYANQLLEKTAGNINKASNLGGIPRPQIYRILSDE